MNRIKRILYAAAVAGSVCIAIAAGSLSASATTKEDVVAAARAAGFPEVYIQAGINKLNEDEYTSEDYDSFIAAMKTYEEEIWAKINEQFGVTGTTAPEKENSTTTSTTTAPAQTEQSGGAVTTKPKPFINMTLEEKVAYVQSLPESEQAKFLASLSTAEKNSIIKQLSLDDKTDIINKLVETGKTMGFYFSVEDLEDDKLTISARDEEGKLIDVSSMGIVVDDTGISHTGLISGVLTAVAAAGAGLYLIGRKLGKEQHE
ncbi:hypothetical protein [Ruminococcus sp.]|uniref:hypothetical protein n=1 Tax=Ruminococcus sp. TaxID=41978 RepID=UPI0025EB5AEB|nr:hypothetical protein [Ruminococcus sp.]MCI5817062.1 hypothetical protein [Ruminococcus sp.]MDY4963639.1 hypothetical protein [Ruminococcus callidus]